jgi:hypothetical protein
MVMKIWELSVTWENTILWEKYLVIREKYFPNDFNGSFISDWEDVNITFETKKMRDTIHIGSGMVAFSEKAVEIMMPFLNGNVQILPLVHPTQKYYLLNVTNVIDALDYDNSEFLKLRSGKMVRVEQYVFKGNIVKNQNIFKIPHFTTSYVYVSDSFRQAVIDNKLTGFNFIELWDSNEVNESELPEPQEWQDPINSESFSFENAMKNAMNSGNTYRSGRWRLRYNQNGDLEIGEVTKKGETYFNVLVYIPPILLTQKWYLDN